MKQKDYSGDTNQSNRPIAFVSIKLHDEEMPDVPFEETPKTQNEFQSERFSARFAEPRQRSKETKKDPQPGENIRKGLTKFSAMENLALMA